MKAFSQRCLECCRQPLLSHLDYIALVDCYTVNISTLNNPKIDYRCLQLVRAKYLRTSFNSPVDDNFHRTAFLAFKRFNGIGSPLPSSQVRQSSLGRVGGHYPARYLKSVISDLFGYNRTRVAPLSAPISVSSCSAGRFLTQWGR